MSRYKYRDTIVEYFKDKDKIIYDLLTKNYQNSIFPFKTIYRIHTEGDENINISSFIAATIIFNKNKDPIKNKISDNASGRGISFLNRLIIEKNLIDRINTFEVGVYIADKIFNKITEDENFKWFINSPVRYRGEIKYEVADFIIVDVANVFFQIKEYTGDNPSILNLKNNIIGEKGINASLDGITRYISKNLNGNFYKYIFIAPGDRTPVLDDLFYLISVECTEYIGTKCSHETNSNESDDILLLMIYDYIKNKRNKDISILSGDNYDFSFITQDVSEPFDRAIFSDEEKSTILNWGDILYDYPDFEFNKENPLTIFEEDFVEDDDGEDDDGEDDE